MTSPAPMKTMILYTCYPFDALGFTPNRYFVYAKYVSGPVLDKNSKGVLNMHKNVSARPVPRAIPFGP